MIKSNNRYAASNFLERTLNVRKESNQNINNVGIQIKTVYFWIHV